MASLNKVFLLGNLTRDPQLSYLPSQTAVVDLGLAVNRKWAGKDGEKKEEVCFVDCVAFGKTAETLNKWCEKGKPILIEGRLHYESWQANDGGKRNKLKIIIENFQFIGEPTITNAPEEKTNNANPDYVGDNPPPPSDGIPF